MAEMGDRFMHVSACTISQSLNALRLALWSLMMMKDDSDEDYGSAVQLHGMLTAVPARCCVAGDGSGADGA